MRCQMWRVWGKPWIKRSGGPEEVRSWRPWIVTLGEEEVWMLKEVNESNILTDMVFQEGT